MRPRDPSAWASSIRPVTAGSPPAYSSAAVSIASASIGASAPSASSVTPAMSSLSEVVFSRSTSLASTPCMICAAASAATAFLLSCAWANRSCASATLPTALTSAVGSVGWTFSPDLSCASAVIGANASAAALTIERSLVRVMCGIPFGQNVVRVG